MLTETTFAAIKTIADAGDLAPRARAIRAAVEAGDTQGATDGRRRLESYLLSMSPEQLEGALDDVLEALRVFRQPAGERIASWLRVHVRSNDAREFWGYIEQRLNPREYGTPTVPQFMVHED